MLAIIDGIDNAPGTKADAMKIPFQLLDSERPRIRSKSPDGGIYGAKSLLGQRVELSLSCPMKQDLVGHAA